MRTWLPAKSVVVWIVGLSMKADPGGDLRHVVHHADDLAGGRCEDGLAVTEPLVVAEPSPSARRPSRTWTQSIAKTGSEQAAIGGEHERSVR
jgi:hypothetical protein